MCHYVGQVYADVDARGTNAFIADPLAPPSTPDRGDVRGWSSVVDSGAVPEAQSRGLEPPPPHLSSFQNGENHYSSGGRARKNLRRGFPAHQSARTTAGAGTEADRPVGHEMACVPFWACVRRGLDFLFYFPARLELLSRHSLFCEVPFFGRARRRGTSPRPFYLNRKCVRFFLYRALSYIVLSMQHVFLIGSLPRALFL